MAFDDIKNFTFKLFKTLSKNDLVRAVMAMRNKVEEQEQENKLLKKEVQKLKDQVNNLKGEQGKPDIKPPKNDDDDDDKKDSGSSSNGSTNKNKRNTTKKDKIKVTRVEKVPIDKSKLPDDAQNKGSRSIIIQDISIDLDNVKFEIPIYYSPSEGKSYEGEIPAAYKGSEFGPGIWSFIKLMHFEGRITQNVLWKMLKGMGIKISEGQINTIILSHKGIDLNNEMNNAREAAINKQNFEQIDDTGARVNGKNGATIAVVNDYMSFYFTNPSKNRLAAIDALTGSRELKFCINEISINYLDSKVGNKTLVKRLSRMVSDRLFTNDEFENEIINAPWLKGKIKSHLKHVREGCAIGALRANLLGPRALILICDDAPQFKGILEHIGLCWIHEIRHYKKLEPSHIDFKDILADFTDEFWDFYEMLKTYKERPSLRKKMKIEKWFNKLFSEETDYFALNLLKKKTFNKKDSLLLFLEYPEIPLHNNASELSVREKVMQRQIKHCFRTWAGAQINDTYLSLMATCRKIGVSFGDFLKDRFFHGDKIPPLAQIIEAMP